MPNAILPEPARPSTHDRVPSGYSLKRQSVPFTAANALGLLVPSPIDFGICAPDDIPAGAHAFRSPLDPDGANDGRMFYVLDNPACRFEHNAFTIDAAPVADADGNSSTVATKPGLSFFREPDLHALFRVRLPYILRTPREVDSLFTAAVNRAMPLPVMSKLVETDWYAHPVSLVLRKPQFGVLHIAAGDVLAQVLLIPRAARRAKTSGRRRGIQ